MAINSKNVRGSAFSKNVDYQHFDHFTHFTTKDGRYYFGEYDEAMGKNKAYGLGIYKDLKTGEIEMHESYYRGARNGAIAIIEPSSQSGVLGFAKEGVPTGPQLNFKNKDTFILKKNTASLGYDGFLIVVYPDGGYLIGGYDKNGNFSGRGIQYDYGFNFTKSQEFGQIDKQKPFDTDIDLSHLQFVQKDFNIVPLNSNKSLQN